MSPGPRPAGRRIAHHINKGAPHGRSVGITELLEAGVHFGHQTRRWNPKMRRFIYGERGGIYIIDLLQDRARCCARRRSSPATLAHRGGTVLFVGTKKQARDDDQGRRRGVPACRTSTTAGSAAC